MRDILKETENFNKLLFEVELKPLQGDRFQPTGFPDIQAATYTDPKGQKMILVESAQSMANRLEKTIIANNNLDVIDQLKGISYVIAELSGDKKNSDKIIKTSSLIESHRLASPYITKNDFWATFEKDSDYGKSKPLDWRKLASTVFKYDVNSLIHGVFFSNEGGGRIRFQRIISSFIEAEDVSEAMSGGVKLSHVSPNGEIVVKGEGKNIFGNVPFHRTEYTAKKIKAYFNVDIATMRSYSLGEEAESMIIALCLYKIRLFLSKGLRLRTACDLKVCSEIKEYGGFLIPEEKELLEILNEKIKKLKTSFSDSTPFIVNGTYEIKEIKKKGESVTSNDSQDGEEQDDTPDE
jgi:CRISPR-associated protein Csb1